MSESYFEKKLSCFDKKELENINLSQLFSLAKGNNKQNEFSEKQNLIKNNPSLNVDKISEQDNILQKR